MTLMSGCSSQATDNSLFCGYLGIPFPLARLVGLQVSMSDNDIEL
jgi:hypothetical protein